MAESRLAGYARYMAQSFIRRVARVVPLLAIAAVALPAAARVDGSSAYTKVQTYSGALRYVRVDLRYEIVEKDPDAAYLIFKYMPPGGSKSSAVTGTLEVIEAGGGVRVFVNLPRMPEYHERIFRDGLLKKLKDEYGAPPPSAKKPPSDKGPSDKAPSDRTPTNPPTDTLKP